MFMEPIEIATAALSPAPRSRPASLKLAIGMLFLGLCAILMLPWALLVGAWLAIATSVRAVIGLASEMRAILNFSGETVLGR